MPSICQQGWLRGSGEEAVNPVGPCGRASLVRLLCCRGYALQGCYRATQVWYLTISAGQLAYFMDLPLKAGAVELKAID